MYTNYCRDGYLKDFEVKITMKVFIEGEEYEKRTKKRKNMLKI